MGFRQYMNTQTENKSIAQECMEYAERVSKFEAVKLLQKAYQQIEDLENPYEIKKQMLDFRQNLMEEIKG